MTRTLTPKQRAARAYRLRTRYGITVAEYEEIKALQGGKCAICKRATGASKALAVDHDHSMEWNGRATRESVRGLLCGRENNRLGWYEANQDTILRYLEFPPARSVLWRKP